MQKKNAKERKFIADRHKIDHLSFICFANWRLHTQRKRKAKIIKARTNFSMGNKFILEWNTLTKNLRKAKKFRTKCLVEKQFQVLKALYEHASRSRVHKSIINHCLQRYSFRLLNAGLSSLCENVQTSRAKRDIMAQIDDYYSQKLRSKSILALRHNF